MASSQMATHLVEDQRAMIRDAIDALREAAGHDIVGWLAPGLTETLDTPDLLAEAGIRYCADWVVDDLPCTMRTTHGPMLTMPYSVELNDIPIMMIQHHRAEELFDRTVAQFDRLYAEAETQGAKVMGLAVHPYISGVPHRIGWFEQALGYMAARARHAVLARPADHGLVSEGDSMNWGTMSRAERDAAYDNIAAVTEQHGAEHRARGGIGGVPRGASRASRSALRTARAQHLGPVSGSGPEGAVPRVHPRRLLAAQQQGPVRQPDRRSVRAWLGGGVARLHAGTRRDADGDRCRDQRGAGLAGGDTAPRTASAGPIVLSGWSAGGHLTAMCLGHPRVVAGLAISGIFELGPLRDTELNDKLRLTDEEIATLSPLRLPVVNKPLAIAYGTANCRRWCRTAAICMRSARRRICRAR